MKLRRREQWRPVLEAETKRWMAKSYEQLRTELVDDKVYEVELGGKNYQVEVDIIEKRDGQLHIAVSVDDGSIPASFFPLSSSFICRKTQ